MKKYTHKNSDKVKSLRAPALREPVNGAAKSADNAVKERDGLAGRELRIANSESRMDTAFCEAKREDGLAGREKAPEIPETEDGVAPGTDIIGACVAGAFFLLCAAGIVYGAIDFWIKA